MKILYVDGSPPGQSSEDYSINPKRYGGGAAAARFLKLRIPGFVLAAKKEGFENFTEADRPRGEDSYKQEWVIPESVYPRLHSGEPAKQVFGSLGYDISDFDLIVTHNRGLRIETEGLKAKYVSWATGGFEEVHPSVEYLLTYNDHQHPKITSPKTKIGRVVLGKPIPNFDLTERGNFIFQCSAIQDCFSCQEVVNFAQKLKIPLILAGPMRMDLKWIDSEYINYLGEISEEQKIKLLKKCRLTTLLHKGHTCFSLSAVEALSVGAPVACYNKLFWPDLISENTGFFIDPKNFEKSMLKAYECAPKLNNFDIYLSSFRHSEEQMCLSFMYNFRAILEDIKNTCKKE